MIATNIEQYTETDLASIFPKRACANTECISKTLEQYTWGPNGEVMCKAHALQAWKEYTEAYRKKHDPNYQPAGKPTKHPFASLKKLSGVQVRYPGYEHLKDGVRSIWTPTRCYPYPNHRAKLGMKGSYETSKCLVLNWGKHQDPNIQQQHTNTNKGEMQ